ncbi:LamB/YcsF family protein [Reyranella sp. CPCC 100927]|uniref:LamB/YcsF family protein n=1 Tax=Reyranella sp. CPCC 100927 TaxID=2599616 RepID=UPI0011B78265|nr:5-oxoprolinase subunit PxpA [Reyranella sp. CPCC 100927]TWT04027.1 5-oxoprolinase subunit PxpA [Reyranella sp. CPCC 100927]
MATEVNVNSDLGESFGPWKMGNDAEILKIVRSANVACGFHAGDPMVMAKTVKLSLENGVSIGAHPGFPDLQGFGRRVMRFTNAEIEMIMAYQIGALMAIATAHGAKVTHVKPHGMMANMSAEDEDLAMAMARAIKAVDPNLIFLAQAVTPQVTAARKVGLRAAEEVFADRTYTDKGILTPRKEPNAMIHDAQESLRAVKRMIEEQAIFSTNGKKIPCQVDSVCVHGDEPTAVATARTVREGLEASQIRIVALPELRSMQ